MNTYNIPRTVLGVLCPFPHLFLIVTLPLSTSFTEEEPGLKWLSTLSVITRLIRYAFRFSDILKLRITTHTLTELRSSQNQPTGMMFQISLDEV